MSRILVVVDETKSSKAVVSTFHNSVWQPEKVILLHVQRLQGRSVMIDMLGDAELSTLKESMQGSEYKEALDRKSEKILDYYKKALEQDEKVKCDTVIRAGHPADEVLKVADEEKVDLILLSSDGQKGLSRLFTGSVAEEVHNSAKVPVIVAKKPVMCEQSYSWKDAYAAVTVTSILVFAMFIIGAIIQKGTLQ